MAITIEHGSGEFEDKGHRFTWWLELHVENPEFGHKSTQLGGSPPEELAKMIASELVPASKR